MYFTACQTPYDYFLGDTPGRVGEWPILTPIHVRYTISSMATDTTFVLDITAAGKEILQDMASDIVAQSGAAIMERANRMANSLSTNAPGFEISSKVGLNRGGSGERAITTIAANDTGDAHQSYIARMALVKAIDAGRV